MCVYIHTHTHIYRKFTNMENIPKATVTSLPDTTLDFGTWKS